MQLCTRLCQERDAEREALIKLNAEKEAEKERRVQLQGEVTTLQEASLIHQEKCIEGLRKARETMYAAESDLIWLINHVTMCRKVILDVNPCPRALLTGLQRLNSCLMLTQEVEAIQRERELEIQEHERLRQNCEHVCRQAGRCKQQRR